MPGEAVLDLEAARPKELGDPGRRLVLLETELGVRVNVEGELGERGALRRRSSVDDLASSGGSIRITALPGRTPAARADGHESGSSSKSDARRGSRCGKRTVLVLWNSRAIASRHAVLALAMLAAACRDPPAAGCASDAERTASVRCEASAQARGRELGGRCRSDRARASPPNACTARAPRWERTSRSRPTRRPRSTRQKTRAAFDAAIDEIKRIEALMTTWRDSEVSRINAAAGASAVKVERRDASVSSRSPYTRARSPRARSTSRSTRCTGSGSSTRTSTRTRRPSGRQGAPRRSSATGTSSSTTTKQTVMLAKAKTQIGLGGIAKGYAVDMAAAPPREGGADVVLRAGRRRPLRARDEARRHASGKPASAIRAAPRASTSRSSRSRDHAFSTAGDYERCVRRGRQALSPHHRSAHGLPGNGVPERDDLGADGAPRRRDRRRRLHPRP